MTEGPLPELALSEEEVDEILRHCGGRAVLVGGQALAFWAQHYGITPLGVLSSNVTSDVDFLGSAQVAHDLAEALEPRGWRLWRAKLDEAGTQTAKISKRVEGRGIKQIDFLSGLVGLDSERIRRRAVTVLLVDGPPLKVLHPLDVLRSRLKNLAVLPSKRNRQGVAQARLAIAVSRAHLEQFVQEAEVRRLLKSIEELVSIAQDKSLDPVYHDFELDPLAAVPTDQVPSEEFRTRRWPRIVELVAAQRRAYTQHRRRSDGAKHQV